MKFALNKGLKSAVLFGSIPIGATYDVVIIGGGSSGMGAAHALLSRGHKVLVVEREAGLGGTAVQAWVNTWIPGIAPPYLESALTTLVAANKASGTLANSYLRSAFAQSGVESQWVTDVDAMAALYASNLAADANITIMPSTQIIALGSSSGERVTSAVLKMASGKKIRIASSLWIDASAEGVLCRLASPIPDVDYYVGEDPQSRFSEALAPATGASMYNISEPDLYFRIDQTTDDSAALAAVATVTTNTPQTSSSPITRPSYIQFDGYPAADAYYPATKLSVNALAGLAQDDGVSLKLGYDGLLAAMRVRQYEFWKYVKLALIKHYLMSESSVGSWSVDYRNWHHSGQSAPMVGVREGYRIVCEYMMRQSDLATLIKTTNIGNNIAMGSHTIDFHRYGAKSSSAIATFNANTLRPSGIRYESLIPKKLKNVFVVGRAYGSSQIHLAARRVSKDMAQLGWAAGHAARLYLDGGLSDVRDVNVATLQGDDYTGFATKLGAVQALYKAGLT